METFKTKAGTELPLTDIKGKPYLQVPYRVQWFREETGQDWSIQTEIVEMSENHSIVRAIIKNPKGDIVSMAHKREDKSHFIDHLEKAESSAIGRALGFFGYGTQYALDLLEGERLADSPLNKIPTPPLVASFQQPPIDHGKYIIQVTGKHTGKALKDMDPADIQRYKEYWQQVLIEKKTVSTNVREFLEKASLYLDNKKMNDHVKGIMGEV